VERLSPQCWREVGRQRKTAAPRELLVPVYEAFTEGFDTPDLRDAKALLDALA
jgi:predicted ATPase